MAPVPRCPQCHCTVLTATMPGAIPDDCHCRCHDVARWALRDGPEPAA